MKHFLWFCILLTALVRSGWAASEPVAYFDAGNPIKYDGTKFYLAWSAHAQDIYYLQEYLPRGETLERYTQMFTVSVIFWDRTPEAAVRAKVAELERRRETDKVCRYLVAENPDKPGEYILEFIVSDGRDGVLDCVEVDIHYYRLVVIDGKKASLLCFYSRRAYGDDILPFMKTIPERRNGWYEGMTRLGMVPRFPK